jgi:hypothetical protein
MQSTSSRARQIRKTAERVDPDLTILPGTFSDETVRALIDTCIIPALLDEFLHTEKIFSESRKEKHNGDQQP